MLNLMVNAKENSGQMTACLLLLEAVRTSKMSISVAANRSNMFNVPQNTLDQLKVTGT